MAPKKQADASDPGFLAMRAFKRAVESANFRLGIENLSLSLDPGEGFTAVSKLVVTAMTTSNTGRPATPTHMVALAEALGPYPYMKNLAFWTVDVRDEGAKALAQYVASNRTLVRLELMNCGLGVAACKFLRDAISGAAGTKPLTTLRLESNPAIGNAGAQELGEGPVCVKELSLSYCGIEGAAGGSALKCGLLSRPGLTHVELKGNRLGAEGVVAVLLGVSSATTLFRLDLTDTGFTPEPELHKALSECLALNTHCHEYALNG